MPRVARDNACFVRMILMLTTSLPRPRAVRALIYGLLMACGLAVFPAAAQQRVQIPPLPEASGQPAVDAYWFPAPAEVTGGHPAPVVIGLHGCSGALDSRHRLIGRYHEMATWLNREGYHFLAPESFASRGLKSICETPNRSRTVNEPERRADVYAAVAWLQARGDVDASRMVLMGWSHGAQTVLHSIDRSAPFVSGRAQPFRAAVAYYPGCTAISQNAAYALTTPLLLMIGENDDWTPAAPCRNLTQRLQQLPAATSAPVEFVSYPDSYHGFDGTAEQRRRGGVGNSRSGTAMVGGTPAARAASRERLFDYLAQQLDRPLRLSAAERFGVHAYRVPAASGFATLEKVDAVPGNAQARERYARFLTLPKPRAFALSEVGGGYASGDTADAIRQALAACPEKQQCALYAVDDQVVWTADPAQRVRQAEVPR